MLQRHFTQFGVSSRNNVARDGSNYLRPEIWPVDHMVNCGIHHTGIVEYSPTRAISNYYNDLMLQKHGISSNKNI